LRPAFSLVVVTRLSHNLGAFGYGLAVVLAWFSGTFGAVSVALRVYASTRVLTLHLNVGL